MWDMKHGWQKNFHEMEIQPRTCMWYNPKYFVSPGYASKHANFRVPAMDRREQNGVGIFVFWWNGQRDLTSSMGNEDACGFKKVSGSIIIFLNTLCAWHIVNWK